MHINIQRIASVPGATYGALHVDGEFLCWTLEDPIRDVKVSGDTAIPPGTYPVIWRKWGKWAKRFQDRYGVPGSLEICEVPGFSAVLFHNGNTPKDTRGCILLGLKAGSPSRPAVLSSMDAVKEFVYRVRDSVPLSVTIVNPGEGR